MRELYDENITFGAGGNCLTNAMLREKIGIKMNLRREADPCRPPETERVLTAKTISNYTREFFPESSNAPSTQAVRREEARFDPYNAVAFAATLQAILGDIDGEIIPYDLIFNSDQTSLKIGEDPVTKVFMVKGTKERLKANNLNAGVTTTRAACSQMRSLQIMCTTNAAGKLVQAVITMKDNEVTEIHTREVILKCFLYTLVFFNKCTILGCERLSTFHSLS